jgi:hypothetical protein
MKAKTRRVFHCRHCRTPWSEDYLADLCFKVDMDNLTKTGNENKNIKASKGSKNPKRNK